MYLGLKNKKPNKSSVILILSSESTKSSRLRTLALVLNVSIICGWTLSETKNCFFFSL